MNANSSNSMPMESFWIHANPTTIDFSKVCHLCLRGDDGSIEMISLYEKPDLEETIKKCVEVEVITVADEPAVVCASCISTLNSWTKFKQLCEYTTSFLKQCLRDKNETDLVPDSVLNSELANFGALSLTPSQMSDLSIGFLDNDSFWNNSMSQQWTMDTSELDSLFTDFRVPKYTKKVQPPEDLSVGSISDEECLDIAVSKSNKKDDDFIHTKAHWKNPKCISMKTMRNKPEKTDLENQNLETLTKYKRYVRKTFHCNVCSETFTKFNELIAHDMTVHTDMPKNFSCKKCGKLFLTNERLATHEIIHRDKLFECKLCQKKFACQKTLDSHLNGHIGLYTCENCGHKATSMHNLRMHERTHSLIKEHSCKDCNKYFSTASSLRRHDRIVHKKIVMFRCDECNYSTSQPSSFKYHKSTHTSQTCICSHCGVSFKNQTLLNFHLKLHDNSNFSCTHCMKLFKRKSSLKEHLNLSHGLGPPKINNFKCDACDSCFSRNRFLKFHKRKCQPT